MVSPREGTQGRRRGLACWAGVAALGLLSLTGCQVEYAGMTLPSGKYMYDDVQYFQPGPEFPWANTQAATQRARMGVQGDVSGEAPFVPPGALPPAQMEGGRITNINSQPMPFPNADANGPAGALPPPGALPPQPGMAPAFAPGIE